MHCTVEIGELNVGDLLSGTVEVDQNVFRLDIYACQYGIISREGRPLTCMHVAILVDRLQCFQNSESNTPELRPGQTPSYGRTESIVLEPLQDQCWPFTLILHMHFVDQRPYMLRSALKAMKCITLNAHVEVVHEFDDDIFFELRGTLWPTFMLATLSVPSHLEGFTHTASHIDSWSFRAIL